jgi:hypothetical protein
MNDDEIRRGPDDSNEPEPRGGGANLALIYGLIALALVAAIVIAAFVVLPFYHRR